VPGRRTAVVLSTAAYERLRAPKSGFTDIMRSSPFTGPDLALKREQSDIRDVSLGADLLHANAFSETVWRRREASVMDWLGWVPGEGLYLNAPTLGEIRNGFARVRSSERRERPSV
jgi:hypothetical protein